MLPRLFKFSTSYRVFLFWWGLALTGLTYLAVYLLPHLSLMGKIVTVLGAVWCVLGSGSAARYANADGVYLWEYEHILPWLNPGATATALLSGFARLGFLLCREAVHYVGAPELVGNQWRLQRRILSCQYRLFCLPAGDQNRTTLKETINQLAQEIKRLEEERLASQVASLVLASAKDKERAENAIGSSRATHIQPK